MVASIGEEAAVQVFDGISVELEVSSKAPTLSRAVATAKRTLFVFIKLKLYLMTFVNFTCEG
jgi:hypothetical protein